jgi:hypothetical protein
MYCCVTKATKRKKRRWRKNERCTGTFRNNIQKPKKKRKMNEIIIFELGFDLG